MTVYLSNSRRRAAAAPSSAGAISFDEDTLYSSIFVPLRAMVPSGEKITSPNHALGVASSDVPGSGALSTYALSPVELST
eukprot:CAMPEP_0119380590 /NCGR_PEP_ID=MMETSP1334-20130426/57684_1 /TAXON_ID=127549 /ORGANISM="Calcidiscus leptoporus, Strain RCC1130" /LENGTH=79 /DNA_ID=CAMNT_0007400485 /DNA_START=335 /DNA_END=574 /DNA_ORIENTATION=-